MADDYQFPENTDPERMKDVALLTRITTLLLALQTSVDMTIAMSHHTSDEEHERLEEKLAYELAPLAVRDIRLAIIERDSV